MGLLKFPTQRSRPRSSEYSVYSAPQTAQETVRALLREVGRSPRGMGCCCSANVAAMIPGNWYAQFKALKLSDGEIHKFIQVYQTIDRDRSGAVELREMLYYLEIEDTDFTRRAFSVFDINRSGKIDFREFLLSLWNYCTLGNATLDIFAFDLYDQDKSGILSGDEVERMMKDLYGNGFKNNKRAQHVVGDIKKINRSGDFDMKTFAKFAKTHQELLFPAFQIQLKIQEKVLGRGFWDRASNRRVQLSKGKYATITQLMQMHASPEIFKEMSKDMKTVLPQAAVAMQVTGTAHQRTSIIKPKPAPTPGPGSSGYHVPEGQVAPMS